MNDFFDAAFKYLLENEGKTFTDQESDPGGPTKFGITLKALQTYLGRPVQAVEVENLNESLAQQIYIKNYWEPLCCDKISTLGLAICLFDTGVLYGVGSTSMIAQKAANNCGGNLKIDGILGFESLKTLNELNLVDFIRAFFFLIIQRIDAVISANPIEAKYRNGWTKRANRLLTLTEGGIEK